MALDFERTDRLRPCSAVPAQAPLHRTSDAPQVKPPPMASNITRSPFLMRPSAMPAQSASGIEAAEVLPCLSTVMTTLAGSMPSLMRRAVDDALVGLVRHEPVEVARGIAGRLEGVLDHIGDHRHRVLEHLPAFHAQMADRLRRGRPAIDIELDLVAAVRTQMRGQDAAVGHGARLLLRLDHDGAGAVAEQHAGGAVGPVEDAREGLGADQQRALGHAAAQQSVDGGQPIDEARTDRLQVEGERRMVMPRPAWIETAVAGKVLSGVEVAQHDQVDILRRHAGIGQRRLRRLDAEIGGQFAVGRDVALANAGALHDPFVGGVDLLGEIGIGDDPLRQIAAGADESRNAVSRCRSGHRSAGAAISALHHDALLGHQRLSDLRHQFVTHHVVADVNGGGEAVRRRRRHGS